MRHPSTSKRPCSNRPIWTGSRSALSSHAPGSSELAARVAPRPPQSLEWHLQLPPRNTGRREDAIRRPRARVPSGASISAAPLKKVLFRVPGMRRAPTTRTLDLIVQRHIFLGGGLNRLWLLSSFSRRSACARGQRGQAHMVARELPDSCSCLGPFGHPQCCPCGSGRSRPTVT